MATNGACECVGGEGEVMICEMEREKRTRGRPRQRSEGENETTGSKVGCWDWIGGGGRDRILTQFRFGDGSRITAQSLVHRPQSPERFAGRKKSPQELPLANQ